MTMGYQDAGKKRVATTVTGNIRKEFKRAPLLSAIPSVSIGLRNHITVSFENEFCVFF